MFRLKHKKVIAVFTVSFMAVVLIIYHPAYRMKGSSILLKYLKSRSSTSSPIGKMKLLLFVGIHSAPSRVERRNAIRETWLTQCRRISNVVCRFFTDGQDPKGQELKGNSRVALKNETALYDDILLAEVPGGVNFAIKYLWMLQWASKRYDFQYFLRLDDDYFICFHKLVLELESHRPKEKFQWGWLHCEVRAATWLDEAFYLVSKDMVQSFLSRRDTLVCHVWESQAIGYWIKNISNITTFGDNKRLLHRRSWFNSKKKMANKKGICHSLIGIHQSYPGKMRTLWSIYKKEKKNIPYHVPPISYNCEYRLAMNYMIWIDKKRWFSEPKLCKDNPIWDRDGEYRGREDYLNVSSDAASPTI